MPFEMFDVGRPLTDVRLNILEREIGVVLPGNYRAFLLRYNGGRPEPNYFPIRGFDNNPYGSLHYFFGVDDSIQSNDIDWNHKILKGRIPRELLPIADDESGNVICLSLQGVNKNAVYYWDHDNEHSPPTYNNIYLVAESFNCFLDSIYFEDVSEEIAKSLGPHFRRLH